MKKKQELSREEIIRLLQNFAKEADSFTFTYGEKSFFASKYKNSESRTLNNPFSIEHIDITKEEIQRLNALVDNSKGAWNKLKD